MVSRKYVVTFTPKGTKARFSHREYDTKSEAEKRVKEIKKTPTTKREMLNPRVLKNPFFKKQF